MQPKAESRLAAFRRHRDQFLGQDEDSPLTPADREGFTGIDYFPERPDLAFELPIDTGGEGVGEVVKLPTSDGDERDFQRAGRVHFDVDGTPATLSVFREVGRGRFFVPFKDATSGDATYKDGRYLDPRAKPDGTLVLDLNYAYNPYCAYGDGWSCPLPPAENVLGVAIEAGERAFARKG